MRRHGSEDHAHVSAVFQGEDAYGVDMAERQYLDFTDMQPFDAKLIKTMEFKKTFRIPDQSGEGSKVPSTSFNHQWLLTDNLIAWNFLWDDEHLVWLTLLLLCDIKWWPQYEALQAMLMAFRLITKLLHFPKLC